MSVIHKFKGDTSIYGWQGVNGMVPTEEGIKDTTMHILLGKDESEAHFITRYFRVEAGGCSPLHQHPHEHEVVILHGKGTVQINDDVTEVTPFDAILISGGDMHQFKNTSDEPLGFLCIIPKLAS
jgi:quercetin dioxygenase-like cupin family protein